MKTINCLAAPGFWAGGQYIVNQFQTTDQLASQQSRLYKGTKKIMQTETKDHWNCLNKEDCATSTSYTHNLQLKNYNGPMFFTKALSYIQTIWTINIFF